MVPQIGSAQSDCCGKVTNNNYWLVVTGTWLLFFHILGTIIPIDELIFSSGVAPTTNQNSPGMVYHWVYLMRCNPLRPAETCTPSLTLPTDGLPSKHGKKVMSPSIQMALDPSQHHLEFESFKSLSLKFLARLQSSQPPDVFLKIGVPRVITCFLIF